MCCDPSNNLSFLHFPAAQPYRDIPQLPIALPCFSSSSIYGCFCLLGVNVPSPKCPSFSKLLSAFTVSGVSLNILDGFHVVGEKHFPSFSIFRFELASSQSHDMQMSRAGYGHDLMTDNDMEVGRRMVAIMLSGIFKPRCCRLFLWRSRRRSLNTWRSQNTCRTSFRLSSLRSTTSSWTKR